MFLAAEHRKISRLIVVEKCSFRTPRRSHVIMLHKLIFKEAVFVISGRLKTLSLHVFRPPDSNGCSHVGCSKPFLYKFAACNLYFYSVQVALTLKFTEHPQRADCLRPSIWETNIWGMIDASICPDRSSSKVMVTSLPQLNLWLMESWENIRSDGRIRVVPKQTTDAE